MLKLSGRLTKTSKMTSLDKWICLSRGALSEEGRKRDDVQYLVWFVNQAIISPLKGAIMLFRFPKVIGTGQERWQFNLF